MDKIEKYIIENRKNFDTEIPSLDVWGEINKHLESKYSIHRIFWKYSGIAAGFLILIFSGIAILQSNFSGKYDEKEISFGDISPEYYETEQFYKTQIDEKTKQLVSLTSDKSVLSDLNQLDEVFIELRQELQNVPKGSEEQIINAIIKNYQTKIEILERVLEKIKPSNKKESKNDKDEIVI